MTTVTKLSCVLGTTDPACRLGLEIWLDNDKIFDSDHMSCTVPFEHVMPENEADHELKFIMKGKLPEHTVIDAQGQIVKDARLSIKDLSFDEILLGDLLAQNAVYTHDFNGTGTQVHDNFYEEMGCNGTVCLKFKTPIYLWLLEKM